MDITTFEHTIRTIDTGKLFRLTQTTPELTGFYAGRGGYELVQTERTVLHLEVGDPVQAWAYGRLRPGRVTKLGRTKVTVNFQQNKQGDRGERAFHPVDLAPTEGTRFDRETIKEA